MLGGHNDRPAASADPCALCSSSFRVCSFSPSCMRGRELAVRGPLSAKLWTKLRELAATVREVRLALAQVLDNTAVCRL